MPIAVEPMPCGHEPGPIRKHWTRDQCSTMRDLGFLDERYELIEGEVFLKMGQKPLHRITVLLLQTWLNSLFGDLRVQGQLPIDVGGADAERNEPEPDVAVTSEPTTAYRDRHPGPDDLLLVAEVSDTTLRFDRSTKSALYARVGIREYWVVDIVGRQIVAHRRPTAEGYTEIVAYRTDESIATLACPDAEVRVSELLPPAAAD